MTAELCGGNVRAMRLDTPHGTIDATIDDFRLLVRPTAHRVATYMRERRLRMLPFVVVADGLLGGADEGPALTIGVHAELFEAEGLTVASHTVAQTRGVSIVDRKTIVDQTVCTLLLRDSAHRLGS